MAGTETPRGKEQAVGILGLGAMGSALAANLASHGFVVAGFDPDGSAGGAHDRRDINVLSSPAAVVRGLAAPRIVFVSVPADAVAGVVDGLVPLLSEGDVVIDAGNSHYLETARREAALRRKGVGFLGLGVSGGPGGARTGPSIMAGGDASAWHVARGVLDRIAASEDGDPCCAYFGEGGAGHFVKMAHNGIEYAHMQLLLEAATLMGRGFGYSRDAVSDAFGDFEGGPAGGLLTQTTAKVFAKRLADGAYVLDRVGAAVGQKGTGRWAVEAALDLGVPVQTIAAAVMARNQSQDAAIGDGTASAPSGGDRPRDHDLEARLSRALWFGFVVSIDQGLRLCRAARERHGWRFDDPDVLSCWRAGSIVRGRAVQDLHDAGLARQSIEGRLESTSADVAWLIAAAMASSTPVPAFFSALSYVQGRSGDRLPTAVLQAQRDVFGRHGLADRETGAALEVDWDD